MKEMKETTVEKMFKDVHLFFYGLAILNLIVGLVAIVLFTLITIIGEKAYWWGIVGGLGMALSSPVVFALGQFVKDFHLMAQKIYGENNTTSQK